MLQRPSPRQLSRDSNHLRRFHRVPQSPVSEKVDPVHFRSVPTPDLAAPTCDTGAFPSIAWTATTFDPRRGLAPVFRCWRSLIAWDERGWRYPADRPVAVARRRGAQQTRILLIGDAPAAGFGVATHELGIAGHTARRLSTLTGRGVEVDVFAHPKLSMRNLARRLQHTHRDFARYDAIVLMLSTTDALTLTSPRAWRKQLLRALFLLQSVTNAPTLVTTTADLGAIESMCPARRSIAGRHSTRLNRETNKVSEARGYPMIELTSAPDLESNTYQLWSESISAALAAALGPTPRPSPDRADSPFTTAIIRSQAAA